MVYGECKRCSQPSCPCYLESLFDKQPQKQQQQKDANAEGAGPKKKKVTAAQLRVQKGTCSSSSLYRTSRLTLPTPSDLAELEGTLGRTMKTSFPNPDDILNFTLTIEPDEGMYKGGSFHFNFAINQNFPHDPPKVKCTQKIYHPNIDLEGNVCLNILREDWKPVLNLNAVIVGLQVRTSTAKVGWTRRRWASTEHGEAQAMANGPGPTVPLPRTQRIGSPEQRGRGRSTVKSGRLQEERADIDERRGSQA